MLTDNWKGNVISPQTICSPQSQRTPQLTHRGTKHLLYLVQDCLYLCQYFNYKISQNLSSFQLSVNQWVRLFKSLRKSHAERRGICVPVCASAGICRAWIRGVLMGTVHNSQILSQKGIREYSCREAHEVMHSISYLPDRVLFPHNSQLLQKTNFGPASLSLQGLCSIPLGFWIQMQYMPESTVSHHCIPPYHSAPLF